MAITNTNTIKITYGTLAGLKSYSPSVGEIIFLTSGTTEGDNKVVQIAVCTGIPASGTPTYEYVTDEALLSKVNTLTEKIYFDKNDSKAHILAELNMHAQKITNLAESTVATDAATVGQVTAVSTRVQALEEGTIENVPYVKKAGDTMTGPLAMSEHKITGLKAGTDNGDAVNVKQLDDAIKGLGTVMNFLGAVYEKPASNTGTLTDNTAFTADKGDVIVVSTVGADGEPNKIADAGKEFVWNGSAWIEIGNEGVAADLVALKTDLNQGAYALKWNTFNLNDENQSKFYGHIKLRPLFVIQIKIL